MKSETFLLATLLVASLGGCLGESAADNFYSRTMGEIKQLRNDNALEIQAVQESTNQALGQTRTSLAATDANVQVISTTLTARVDGLESAMAPALVWKDKDNAVVTRTSFNGAPHLFDAATSALWPIDPTTGALTCTAMQLGATFTDVYLGRIYFTRADNCYAYASNPGAARNDDGYVDLLGAHASNKIRLLAYCYVPDSDRGNAPTFVRLQGAPSVAAVEVRYYVEPGSDCVATATPVRLEQAALLAQLFVTKPSTNFSGPLHAELVLSR